MKNNTTDRQVRFMKLFEPEHERLEKYCLALTGDREEARDLLGEAVLQSFQRMDSLRDERKFPHYLFRVAKRLHLKKVRRWWSFHSAEGPSMMIADLTPDAASQLDFRILHEALLKLPVKLRQAVVLYEISGFSLKEVAEMENCTLSAVKARVMRGRNKLSRLLKDPPHSDEVSQKDHSTYGSDIQKLI